MKRSPKKGLFAAVPVKGPPCTRCKAIMKQKGWLWVCPKCGMSWERDYGP